MSDKHGGYRTPTQPAPASGPGKLARRTDGGPGQKVQTASGMAYGDRQALAAQEKTAAMSQANSITPATITGSPQAAGGPPQMPPLDAPTARPNEPVTSGVPIGPGPGPSPMFQPPDPAAGTGTMTALLQRLSPTDATGILGKLLMSAQARNA